MQNEPNTEDGQAIIEHHLRLFGVNGPSFPVEVLYRTKSACLGEKFSAVKEGLILIAVMPEGATVEGLEISIYDVNFNLVPNVFLRGDHSTVRLRTLHPWKVFNAKNGEAIVVDQEGKSIWLWYPLGMGGILFLGSDLAKDIIRFKQGDPECVLNNRRDNLWGFDFERPNYLYESQLKDEPHYERSVDEWMNFLVNFISMKLHVKTPFLLPGGAKGAVVITGDDDQAYLETYQEQLHFLKETPITYFMHPLTRHTSETVKTILNKPFIDLGLHPDALNDPKSYPSIFLEQVDWFKKLFGFWPHSVRNHGYLNDGYWGHLPAWISSGVTLSLNIPGLDGRILTGSLLPSRVAFGGTLTNHWSLLTAIGDGVVFIKEYCQKQPEQYVYDLADTIVHGGIPGIIVLNLHPQNIDKTRSLHQAVLDLIAHGFHPWTVSECLQWFISRDKEIR